MRASVSRTNGLATTTMAVKRGGPDGLRPGAVCRAVRPVRSLGLPIRCGDDSAVLTHRPAGTGSVARRLSVEPGPPPASGSVTTPGSHGGQPGGGAEQVAPGEQVARRRRSSSGVQDARISICADAASPAIAPKLSDATRVTVPLAARERRPVAVQGLGQPGPADAGQQRVGRHLVLELGPHVGHQPEGALPGLVARGVVQQHQPAGAELDVGVERGRPRRRSAPRRTGPAAAAPGSPRARPRTGGWRRAARRVPGRTPPGTSSASRRATMAEAYVGRGRRPGRRDSRAVGRARRVPYPHASGRPPRPALEPALGQRGLPRRHDVPPPPGRRGGRGLPGRRAAGDRCGGGGGRRAGRRPPATCPGRSLSGVAGVVGLVSFYAALAAGHDGRGLADRRAGRRRPRVRRARPRASGRRPSSWWASSSPSPASCWPADRSCPAGPARGRCCWPRWRPSASAWRCWRSREGSRHSTLMTLVTMRRHVGDPAGGRPGGGAGPRDAPVRVCPLPARRGAGGTGRPRRRRRPTSASAWPVGATTSASSRCSARSTRSSLCCWPGCCTASGSGGSSRPVSRVPWPAWCSSPPADAPRLSLARRTP